jgi:hypothetical protein
VKREAGFALQFQQQIEFDICRSLHRCDCLQRNMLQVKSHLRIAADRPHIVERTADIMLAAHLQQLTKLLSVEKGVMDFEPRNDRHLSESKLLGQIFGNQEVEVGVMSETQRSGA